MDNTTGESRQGAAIASVKPGTAERGKAHTLHIALDPSAGRVPDSVPSRVLIGPFEAAAIARDGDTITCTIAVPKDANRGALFDCHLEFPGGRTGVTVIKKNNVLRVGGE